MKKHVFAALFALLTLVWGAALGAELPGIAVFSPGLARLSQMESADVHAEAEIGVAKAMYARDLSVLDSMLSGTTFAYDRTDAGETLEIINGGDVLAAYQLEENAALDAMTGALEGRAILERAPLEGVAAWLEGLRAGDALALGFRVTEPFALVRTMSDDGTRLTKIQLSGAIAREGEADWKVSGFMRQPAGRAPKDTFEITIAKDEKNTVELLYSALREHEVTRKNKEGTASVKTTLRAVGKIGGYGVSSRLSVTMKNRYALQEGGALSERVSISATLSHQDNTPGRRWQRMNQVEAETKHAIRLTTAQESAAPVDLTDDVTISVTMDGNTVLEGSASVRLTAGGAARLSPNAEAITPQSAQLLAKAVYARLDDKTKETIYKGL